MRGTSVHGVAASAGNASPAGIDTCGGASSRRAPRTTTAWATTSSPCSIQAATVVTALPARRTFVRIVAVPTAIGPVDILARAADGATVAVELKRRGDIDGVEQLTRYLELLNRDPLLAPVRGVYAAQLIRPQARVLAEDRGITCVTLDYDAMRGVDDVDSRLF